MNNKVDYTVKVDGMLDQAKREHTPENEQEWLDLAMAALDQAGVPASAQRKILATVAAELAQVGVEVRS